MNWIVIDINQVIIKYFELKVLVGVEGGGLRDFSCLLSFFLSLWFSPSFPFIRKQIDMDGRRNLSTLPSFGLGLSPFFFFVVSPLSHRHVTPKSTIPIFEHYEVCDEESNDILLVNLT